MSKATEKNDKNERWIELAARPVVFSANTPDVNAPEWCPPWCAEQLKKDADPAYVPHPVSALTSDKRRCDSLEAAVPLDYLGYRVLDEDGEKVHFGNVYVKLTQWHGNFQTVIEVGDHFFNSEALDPEDMQTRRVGRLSIKRAKELIAVLQTAVELAEETP